MTSLLTLATLDGTYDVVYLSESDNGYLTLDGAKAVVTILDGKLSGKDDLGGVWCASLWLDEDGIGIRATISFDTAPEDVCILNASGLPTREPQTMEGRVDVIKIGGKISLRGKIRHGVVTFSITGSRREYGQNPGNGNQKSASGPA